MTVNTFTNFSILVRYIPEWLPGGGFKKIGRIWNSEMKKSRDIPYEIVKESIVSSIIIF